MQASAGQSGHASAGGVPSKTPTPRATPSPSPPPPHPSGSLGNYDVAERWLTFTEHAGVALGNRVLQVTVRYPDVGQAKYSGAPGTSHFPLVVFAPGYRQCSASYSILLREWASAGYVVAAVNFPRTNCHVVSPDEADLVNQPADLAFVIHQLDQMSSQPSGTLSGMINPTRVAVAGHSDGGDTVGRHGRDELLPVSAPARGGRACGGGVAGVLRALVHGADGTDALRSGHRRHLESPGREPAAIPGRSQRAAVLPAANRG